MRTETRAFERAWLKAFDFLAKHETVIWVAATLALIEWVYFWFVTAGTLQQWPVYGIYYDWLSDAFRAGQLHVQKLPNPELLTKENPYDPRHARLWIGDLSLHNGKYYLYWGPVPAAIQGAVKEIFSINRSIGDQYLVFLHISMAGLSAAFLVFRMATKLFSRLPLPVICLAMLTVAFINPVLHSLTNGNVYLVAIAGAQGFFMLGLLLAFEAIVNSGSGWRKRLLLLACGSISFGLAMGCRASIAPAVIVSAFASGFLLEPWRKSSWERRFTGLAAALVPTGLAGLGLLYYNWVRFDDLLEFGTNLQTGPFPFRFDTKDIPVNLYTYFLRPPALSCHFPYLFQEWFPAPDFPGFLTRPEGYLLNEPVVGILLASPLVLIIPFAFAIKRKSLSAPRRRALLFCFVSFLAAGTLPGIVPLGLYMATMRYQGDVILGLCLLSLLGFFFIWSRLPSKGYLLLASITVVMALHTIAFGLALGYQGYNGHVHHQNPKLDKRLRRDWSLCADDAPKFPRFAPNGNTNEDNSTSQKRRGNR